MLILQKHNAWILHNITLTDENYTYNIPCYKPNFPILRLE